MHLFMCCTLLLSLPLLCTCDLRNQMKKLSTDENRSALECLESLIDVTNWILPNFLIISNESSAPDYNFFKRYPNFGWKLIDSGQNHNLTYFSNIILFANNFVELNETLSAISIRQLDGRVKIVISVKEDFASLTEIKTASKEVSATMWKLDKIRVVYLVHCKGDLLVMTYFPFARNCQVGDLEVLDVWRETDFENRSELFPEKMLNMHGCVRNHSAVFDEGIGLQLHKEFTETGEMILGGVAGRLITIVAEKMNMQLHLLPELKSFTLLIDQIIQDKSLFSIAGNIPIANRLKHINQDFGYMEESFGFGYITGGFEVSWKNLVWPLSNEAWVYIGCIFLLFSGLIYLVNRFDRYKIGSDKLMILDGLGIFFGTSRALPQSSFRRYLIGMWIVYSFLINAFYNSGFVSFLTTPNEMRVINTLEDLIADGMDFGGGTWHREFYHDHTDPVMMKIYKNFKIWTVDESAEFLKNRQGATGVLTSYVRKYNSDHSDNVDNQIRILKEKALTYHVPIFMRRGSPFTFGVHYYTSQVLQSGLLGYWLGHYTQTPQSEGIGADSPSRISMQHLRGIFYLYIAGSIFSCLVFLAELIFQKYSLHSGF